MSLSHNEIEALLTAAGQPFEIETITINGVPLPCWKHAAQSMPALMEMSREYSERTFLVYRDEKITFGEHYRRVAALSRQLIDRFGIRKGDRVAIAMRNYPEWVITFWAAAVAGAVVVPLNAWWTSRELAYGLGDSGARVAVVDEERFRRLQQVDIDLPLKHVIVTRCQSLPEDVVDLATLLDDIPPDISLPPVDIAPDDHATIFYTSGTTGFPKGAIGTHRNFCGVATAQAYLGAHTLLRAGGSLESLVALKQIPQVALLTVPLFHVTGCHAIMQGMLSSGGKLVLMHKWDPAAALDAIETERVTMFGGVPSMVWELLNYPGIDRCDISSLLSLGYGGAPAPPELLRTIQRRAPNSNALNGWGITETSSGITGISGEDYIRKPDSVGRPLPICEVMAVNAEGNALPPGHQGELWVRGANVTMGYWNKPAATASAFTDGWFHTGDVGKIDEEGFVYILDRLKDIIIRGGENVYCAEVEAALVEHPAVNAACVFGAPHPVLGEEVTAVVELKSGAKLTEVELASHAAINLAKFKVPSKIWFHPDPLPKGATGKVQKKLLRAEYIGNEGGLN